MLDLVARECERIDSRFLEPACGDGNFLIEVLVRKLQTVNRQNPREFSRWERDGLLSLCSLYGIDLLGDNVLACRERLVAFIAEARLGQFKEPASDAFLMSARFVIERNIVQGDALTLLTASGSPIVFSEWVPVNGSMIKRRDFKYSQLLGHAQIVSSPLFSDLGEDVFLPEPVGEYPPKHYLRLHEHGEA
jgi:hypothetical protein